MSLANLTNNILTDTNLTGILIGNGTADATAVAGTASQLLRRNAANNGYEFFTHDFIVSGAAAGGELSGTYPNPSILNSAVINKVLTGLNLSGGGTIAATDSILTAFGKIQNQISGMVGGVIYQGVWNASTNSPALTSSVGTKGYYYIVSVAGSTNLNGITDWKVGDWAIFNGSTWDKVDNTDAVSSVNGFTGAVSLTTANISEVTNLYYTDARARGALSFVAGSGAYNPTTGVITIPTNTNQLTNGAGFITGNQTITLTGNVTGSGTTSIATTIANSVVTNAMLVNSSFNIGTTSISLGRASAAQILTGVSIDGSAVLLSSTGGMTTQHGDNRLGYSNAIASTQAGLFPTTNNANAVLTLNTHPGNYYAQLGFSPNGNVYYRYFNNVTIDTTLAWQTVWTTANDGSGSGLDADLLDGMQPNTGNAINTIVQRDGSGNFSAGTITAALSGNATTATTLQTTRTINGTSFNGSANITTSSWGTARTITIGSTGKSVDGSGNVSWSLTELGVAGAYLPLSGGSLTGSLSLGYSNSLILGASPYRLLINRSSAGMLPVYIDDEYDNSASSVNFRMRTAGTAINALTILGSGNIGIGVVSPSEKLEVRGSGLFSDSKFQHIRVGVESDLAVIRTDWYSGAGGAQRDLSLQYGLSERIRLTSAGVTVTNVATFSGDVVVTGGGSRTVRLYGGSNGSVRIAGDGTTYATSLEFRNTDNGTLNAAIFNYGTVGVHQYLSIGGTTYNNAPLYITNGFVEVKDSAATQDTGTYAPFGVTRTNSASTLAYIAMTRQGSQVWGFGINASNNLAIGTVTGVTQVIGNAMTMTSSGLATFAAGVNITSGDLYIVSNAGNGILSANGTRAIVITDSAVTLNRATSITNSTASTSSTTGALIVTGGVGVGGSVYAASFFESSDKTIKTLIQDDYLVAGIESVTPKLYTKNGKTELGYYAQDLIGLLDSSVTKDENGKLNLSYREVLVAKVYSLEKRVKELEERYGVQ